MTTYCDFAPGNPLHEPYHDLEYGFPAREDSVLFERLILEINQAGLSWATILKKRQNFQNAYSHFEIDAVAAYGEEDRARLLSDAGIIRNRLKVDAAIENARRLVQIREEYGSFAGWLDHHHPLTKDEWVKLFKKTFRFTGGEIVNEFLMSLGYLPGAHTEACPIYHEIAVLDPPWMQGRRGD
jgi:DNA-3-methyladenine glycosylase I